MVSFSEAWSSIRKELEVFPQQRFQLSWQVAAHCPELQLIVCSGSVRFDSPCCAGLNTRGPVGLCPHRPLQKERSLRGLLKELTWKDLLQRYALAVGWNIVLKTFLVKPNERCCLQTLERAGWASPAQERSGGKMPSVRRRSALVPMGLSSSSFIHVLVRTAHISRAQHVLFAGWGSSQF